MTSKERIQTVLEGGVPDRPPLFDLLRNRAVLEHFSGASLKNAPEDCVYLGIRNALDGTRSVRFPDVPGEEVLPDGRRQLRREWTTWTVWPETPPMEKVLDAFRARVKALEQRLDDSASFDEEAARIRAGIEQHVQLLGPDFGFFGPGSSVGFMAYTQWGLEPFCYALAEEPELFSRFWELNTRTAVRRIACLDLADLICGVFCGEDIAFKGGTLFSPALLRKEYFPRLRRIVQAYHEKHLPVMFHSDGDLMGILDDLYDCGIDLLNPIETIAGMDPQEIRRRCPRLILAGGIDVSQLLPYGTPEEVAEGTRKLIEQAGPGVLVGSSTELHDEVPLENYQAMVETVRNWRY